MTQPLEAAQRTLTVAEQALVARYFARQKRVMTIVSWGLAAVGLGIIFVGCRLISDAPGPAVGFGALGLFVIALPRWIAAVARRRPSPVALRVRATCRTEWVQGGMIPWLGSFRVEMLPEWVPSWRDGAELEIDVCPLLHRSRNDVVAVFLLAPPSTSNNGAPMTRLQS